MEGEDKGEVVAGGEAFQLSGETPEQVEAKEREKRKWTPPKKFNTVEEFLAATQDVRIRAESLLIDIQAVQRSAEDIIRTAAAGMEEAGVLKAENEALKGKLAKLKEAMQ